MESVKSESEIVKSEIVKSESVKSVLLPPATIESVSSLLLGPSVSSHKLFAENRPSLLSVNELSEFHLASALNPPPNLMSFSWLVFL